METLYFLVLDDAKRGPYVRDELIDAGLEPGTLVWFKGCAGWVRAERIPELAGLLKEDRKARRRDRKARRVAARLPAPETLGWLYRLAMLFHVPAGAFFILGSAALLVALILWFIAVNDPHRGPLLARAFTFVLLSGLASTGLAVPLLVIELSLLGVFVWNCYRIVWAVSPDDDREPNPIMEMLSGMPLYIPLFLVALFFVLVVLALYIVVIASIYKVALGLNRVIEHYHMDVPPVPVRLSYWTAVSALLLLLGPFSLPLFVLLPIWAHKIAAVATAICEERREAVEGPPVYAE